MRFGRRLSLRFAVGLTAVLVPATAWAEGEGEPATQGFFSIVFSGGWVGISIVLVLLALSITAAYLVIEQVLTMRRGELMPEGLADEVRQFLIERRVRDADQACRNRPSFLSFILLNGLTEVEGGWSAVEKAVEDATAEQTARMMRRIEYLSVIGNIAPMIGLLGTVTGIIFAFRQLAATRGSAAELAEGIYQALVTTAGGLLIAIPALAAFAILRNRLDQYAAEAAYTVQHVFAPLKQRRKPTGESAAAATSPPPPPTRRGER